MPANCFIIVAESSKGVFPSPSLRQEPTTYTLYYCSDDDAS
jgi:hypothetical protein